MLQALLLTLKGAEAAVPIGLLFAGLAQVKRQELVAPARRGVVLGVAASLAAAALLEARLIDREIYTGAVWFGAILLEIAFLRWLWTAGKVTPLPADRPFPVSFRQAALVFLFCFVAVLVSGPDVVLFPTRVFIQTTDYLNTELLVKVSGGLVGIILSAGLAVALARGAGGLANRWFLGTVIPALGVLVARQGVEVLRILLVTGILPMFQWLLAVMIPLINYQALFFYALMLAALVPLLLGRPRITEEAFGLNAAQRRKMLAQVRRQARRALAAAGLTALVTFLVAAGNAYANRPVKLSPAVPVTATEGEIRIPVAEVSDGKLHRYAATAGGTEVRFLVLKKGGAALGVALDACEICGPTGYYQRGNQVVCKACDVVINPATVGFKGGCNPVPLEYRVKDGAVVIQEASLAREKERFD